MIVRYHLACNGCKAVIRLRIAINFSEREAFDFACSRCGQPITGAMAIDQKNVNIGGIIDLRGAQEVPDVEQYEQRYTVDRRFAEHGDASDALGFSSLLAAQARHGDDFLPRVKRHARLLELVKQQAPVLQRLFHTYRNASWPLFQQVVRENISDELPLIEPVDRQYALYSQLQWVTTPIFSSSWFLAFINDCHQLFVDAHAAASEEFDALTHDSLVLSVVAQSQYNSFTVMLRLLGQLDDFRLALFEWDPESPNAPFPSELVIRSDTKFHELKSLYVDAFETSCKGLTIIQGLLNVRDRGARSIFPEHPVLKNFKPASLKQFHDKPNAPKLDWLVATPFEVWNQSLLDPKFRNAIGHHSAFFDPASNEVTFPKDRIATVMESIPYGEFQFRVLRAVLASHMLNHFVKMLNVCRWLLSAGGPMPSIQQASPPGPAVPNSSSASGAA